MRGRINPVKQRSGASDNLSKRFQDTGVIVPGSKPEFDRKPTKAEDEVMTDERLVRVNKSRRQRGLPPLRRP